VSRPRQEIEQLSAQATERFRVQHPGLQLGPVAVVIPALNEAESVAGVLKEIPASACGLGVSTIVVDDGSEDATGTIARHYAHVARLTRNCGQGAAFRVGYRLARDHGARFIVTLDADGQWDPGDIPAVLEPVARGEADFALGSRTLGRADAGSPLRRLGVHVFATLVRLMTGTAVTDTSSGLRAMTAELTADVRQEEAQYQSSELLLGALMRGYRVVERPTVMHPRAGGESAKGHDLLYGLRYARVVLRTWRRERRAAACGVMVAEPLAERTASR
jgi:glycosyltransferase involved in cell wall biosynthesis